MAGTFVDTNVLVYAHDRDEPAKREIATRLLREGGDEGWVISAQVMSEFFTVVTRRLTTPLDPAAARAAVAALARWTVVPVDAGLVVRACQLSADQDLSLWDAQIVAAADRAGCGTLLTEDLSHDQVLAGVRVRDPFA